MTVLVLAFADAETFDDVELVTLITSHRGSPYERDPRYPASARPRDYSAEQELRLAVAVRAKRLDPSRLLTDSVLPVNGPPVVCRDGVVLSGNGRTQSMRAAMKLGLYGEVRSGIMERSVVWIRPRGAQMLRVPVLVRVMDTAVDSLTDLAREVPNLVAGESPLNDSPKYQPVRGRQVPRFGAPMRPSWPLR